MGRGHWPEDEGGGWCAACGAPLPPRPAGKRGAHQKYCDPSTGRRWCGDWGRALTRLLALSSMVVDTVPRNRKQQTKAKIGGRISYEGAEVRYEEGD